MICTKRLKMTLALVLALVMSCQVPAIPQACCLRMLATDSRETCCVKPNSYDGWSISSGDSGEQECCSTENKTAIRCELGKFGLGCCACCDTELAIPGQVIYSTRSSADSFLAINVGGLAKWCNSSSSRHAVLLNANSRQYLYFASSKNTCSRLCSWQC